MNDPCQRCAEQSVETFDGLTLCADCWTLDDVQSDLAWPGAIALAEKEIPIIYRNLKIGKLPDRAAFIKMIRLRSNEEFPGIYAYGKTGTGKTYSMTAKLIFDAVSTWENPDVRYFRGGELSNEISERTRPGGKGDFDKWFTRVKECDVLGIDEMDKTRFSQRVTAELFELIEFRFSQSRPILFVAQCGTDRLLSKFPPKEREEAEGLIRRIHDFCRPVHFKREEVVA